MLLNNKWDVEMVTDANLKFQINRYVYIKLTQKDI